MQGGCVDLEGGLGWCELGGDAGARVGGWELSFAAVGGGEDGWSRVGVRLARHFGGLEVFLRGCGGKSVKVEMNLVRVGMGLSRFALLMLAL